MVTSLSSALRIEAYSTPMTPVPMATSVRGVVVNFGNYNERSTASAELAMTG